MPLIPGMCRLCTVRRLFGRRLHCICERRLWFPVHLTGDPLEGDKPLSFWINDDR